ncbi:hypothetical protein EDD58_103468 [Hazenella coriacea]|uniref:Uncharacterized protein n=1 Tax=Hazenella coriacea TaxID=1179467 RepID=A0A4R3L5S1_9BACL|nr:hypothetical protein EDD58_103468 [Hazenella coriacea]
MKRVCVFAGSNVGTSPQYKEAAIQLGLELAKQNIEVVYGDSCGYSFRK